MFVEFSVGNFRSFKDIVTLSMVAAKLKSKNMELDKRRVFRINDSLDLLKCAAIYGANASGKSNLIKAMAFMRQFVLDSSRETQVTDAINIDRYRLSTEMAGQPAFFEIIFYIEDTRYRYGFTVDRERVQSEWLYHVPNKRERKLFFREGDDFEVSSVFKEGRGLEARTRANALFLSVVAQFNGQISQDIFTWFWELIIISGLDDTEYKHITPDLADKDETFKQALIMFIKHLDVGISDIEIDIKTISEQEMPREFVEAVQETFLNKDNITLTGITKQQTETYISTLHKQYDAENQQIAQVDFNLTSHESEGTKKAFYLAGPILGALQADGTIIIDELDARLHPLITIAIISLFQSQAANPHGVQLIFTTHDTNLLSHKYFRRDQIWFTEKDRYGATDLYSLAEYKVRNDASFEKDYIAGKYGAIPFIGNLENLLEEQFNGEAPA